MWFSWGLNNQKRSLCLSSLDTVLWHLCNWRIVVSRQTETVDVARLLSPNRVEIQASVVVVVVDLFNQTSVVVTRRRHLRPTSLTGGWNNSGLSWPSVPAPRRLARGAPGPRVLRTASIVIDPTRVALLPQASGRVEINANYRPTCFGPSRQRITLAAVAVWCYGSQCVEVLLMPR